MINLSALAGDLCGYNLLSLYRASGFMRQICLFCLDTASELSREKAGIPKGGKWSVHKFGGTCVGSPERILNVAKIIASDDSELKLVTVSAMAKVTDSLYSLLENAANRENIYEDTLVSLYEKHKNAATELIGQGEELDAFLTQLHEDIQNLKAVLKAIFISEQLPNHS